MTDLSDWLTVPEACERLGIRPRTLDNRVHDRLIERRMRPTPGRRPLPVHNPADVARLMTRAPAVEVSPRNPQKCEIDAESAAKLPALLEQLVAAILGAVTKQSPQLPAPPPQSPQPPQSPAPRQWLTLTEAAVYSGLSETCLRKLVAKEELFALRDRGLKLRKADLDDFATAARGRAARAAR